MTEPLTGAQKTRLRGLGQTRADAAFVGKEGVTPGFLADLDRLLQVQGLVKLRFTGGQDRHERADLSARIAAAAPAVLVGSVGHTALFWRANDAGQKLL